MGALRQNRKLWTLFLILLAGVLMNLALFAVSVRINRGGANRSYLGSITGEECQIDDITAKNIGNSYKDVNAENGYQYYVLFLHVTNRSKNTEWVDNLGFYPQGIGMDDIIDHHREETMQKDTTFLFDNARVIPPGEEAVIPYHIQVKRGVKKISAYYYGSNGAEEAQEIQIML